MKNYLLGLYEKAMPGDWDWAKKLETAGEKGFDYVEMSVDETDAKLARLDWTQQERRDFVHLSADRLPVTSICLSGHRKYTIGSHIPEIRAKGMEIMENAICFAHDIGVRIIQLAGYDVYYNETSDEESKKLFTENLAKSAHMASAYGVILALETMENDFMNTTEKAMEYVNKINSPYLGVYPDTGNICNATKDPVGDLYTGRGHIFSAHFKETVPGVFRNMMYGDGQVNFDEISKALLDMNVRRFTAEFWHLEGRDPYKDMEYASNFFKKVLVNA